MTKFAAMNTKAMKSYYENNEATSANAAEMLLTVAGKQHFPAEGLYIGRLSNASTEIPALIDINETKGLCFLYNDEKSRISVNTCIERLAWRIAMTLPSNLCDIILYNGGNPGDCFNTHTRISNYLMGERTIKVYFDGYTESFSAVLDDVYNSILDRMSSINCLGKRNLYELNESLGRDAKMKYQFIILTDFPMHQSNANLSRLAQIIEVGAKAGVFVFMSWNMKAEFPKEMNFNPKELLSSMELIFPKGDRFYIKNSGYDELLNHFALKLDDEPINPFEADKWARHINCESEIVRRNSKPTSLKQDYKSLHAKDYEPVFSEISVTIGLDINDKHPVTLRFNAKDYIHGFILGQSGSGKSVLINNIITSLILKYSPEDLMLYLMDFKGVEFNRYRDVKHTKAVLVDNSDPQMTLEVLRELFEENKRRVKLWQQEAVNNIDGYNRKYSDQRLPQILFIADECQVMFRTANNGTERLIQQEISEILNIIATQGRSQGIHMLLATQQLDETDISGQILKNLTECFLMMSAPSDSDRLVPDSSSITRKQNVGMTCYYHKQSLESQTQTFFATEEELKDAINAAKEKAKDTKSNGEHYFCGSSVFYLNNDVEQINNLSNECPVAIVGRNIGINSRTVCIPIRKDFYENILILGANNEGQASSVLINALVSLIKSYQCRGVYSRFYVIDCLSSNSNQYKKNLQYLSEEGLCTLVERHKSGDLFKDLVNSINKGLATPAVLAIIGNEKFIEIKRKMALSTKEQGSSIIGEDGILGFDMTELDSVMGDSADSDDISDMNFPKALTYILEEGPIHGIHTIMQVNKPSNILFTDDYEIDAALKFRHKVILRSENKYMIPLRFTHDINVEILSDDADHLRAYYYPDGEEPMLFTPYQMYQEDGF